MSSCYSPHGFVIKDLSTYRKEGKYFQGCCEIETFHDRYINKAFFSPMSFSHNTFLKNRNFATLSGTSIVILFTLVRTEWVCNISMSHSKYSTLREFCLDPNSCSSLYLSIPTRGIQNIGISLCIRVVITVNTIYAIKHLVFIHQQIAVSGMALELKTWVELQLLPLDQS